MGSPDHEKILSNVPQMLLDHESWRAPYKVKIRPSALPFCQVEYLFAELDPIMASVGDSFIERIFVNIGSATHDVIQTYLGRAGILYGKWKCKKCYWVSSPQLGTPYCGEKRLTWERGTDLEGNGIGPPEGPCNAGFATRYEEFRLEDPVSGLKGHCDGIIMVAGRLYLLEVKTKPSSSVVRALKEPDHTHICQASTYAEMATPAKWGLDGEIEGIAFCYIPRDYPNKMRFMFHPKDSTTLDNFRKELPAVKKMLETGKMRRARAVCPTVQYARKVKYCEFADQCFRPDRPKYLRKLWLRRRKAKEREDMEADTL